MGKDKREVIGVEINFEGIAQAARNAEDLDKCLLEINTLNPDKITLKQEIFTLKSVPAIDGFKDKKKAFSPKVVGIKSIKVQSLAIIKDGTVTINGSLDVPEKGNRVVTLDECLFATETEAREVAKVLTEIELEKAKTYADNYNEAVNFLVKQLEDDRF